MAIANLIGGLSAEQILRMPHDEQVLLIDGKLSQCKQVRYYSDKEFVGSKTDWAISPRA
jgi:hypothetical protein